MENVIISPSQQTGPEENLLRPIAQKLYEKLKADNLVNTAIVPAFPGTDNEALRQVIAWSNNFVRANGGTGYHLELHGDAGGYGTGASGLYKTDAGKAFISPILQGIMNITPWSDIGLKKRTDLGALNQTIAIAGLLEVSFYDNSEELKWMQNNTELIADTIKVGIYAALKIIPPSRVMTILELLKVIHEKTKTKTYPGIDVDYWAKKAPSIDNFTGFCTVIAEALQKG